MQQEKHTITNEDHTHADQQERLYSNIPPGSCSHTSLQYLTIESTDMIMSLFLVCCRA